jgi:hypothetical protein
MREKNPAWVLAKKFHWVCRSGEVPFDYKVERRFEPGRDYPGAWSKTSNQSKQRNSFCRRHAPVQLTELQ